jgi:hypothetical protein
MRYQAVDAGRTIIREGHIPTSFFLIMSGTAEVLVARSDRILRTNVNKFYLLIHISFLDIDKGGFLW